MVIASPEGGSRVSVALPGWRAVPATLHPLDPNIRLPRVPAGTVRSLEGAELVLVEGL